MNKEFVPYELALELKQLGFDEPCMASKNMNNDKGLIQLPLYQQAFRWFREKYSDLDFGVSKIHNGTNNYHYHINLTWEFFEGTYEEAELACLTKLIEIVEQQNQK
jgi:hypothetical protein